MHQAELDLAEALAAELGVEVRRPQAALLDLLLQRRHRAHRAARSRGRASRAARSPRGRTSRIQSRCAWNSGSVEKSHMGVVQQVMRIVVVGATGNHGSSLVRRLSARPGVDAVVGVARRRPSLVAARRSRGTQARHREGRPRAAARGADAVVPSPGSSSPGRNEHVTHAVNVDGQRARVRGRGARRRAARSSTRPRSAPTRPGRRTARVDESWPTHGDRDLVLLAPQGRGRADPRLVRGGAPRRARRAHAARAVLQARGGDADPAAVRRAVPPARARAARALPVLPVTDAPALPGRAHRRPRRGLPAGARRDDAARGAYNVAADPVLDGATLGAALGAGRVPVPRARCCARGALGVVPRCACSRPSRAGSTWRSACRSWTRRGSRELGWEPRRIVGRGVRRAASTACATAPGSTRRRSTADTSGPAPRPRGPHRCRAAPRA